MHLALQCSLAVVFVRSSMMECCTTHAIGEAHAMVGFDSISLCRAMSFSGVVDMSSGDCDLGYFWFRVRDEIGISNKVKLREVRIIFVSVAALNGLQRHTQVGLG